MSDDQDDSDGYEGMEAREMAADQMEEDLAEVRRRTIEEAARRVRAAYGDDSMEDSGSQAVAEICARIVEAMLTEDQNGIGPGSKEPA